MDQNNKPNRGITGYILLLLILLGILSMVSFYTGRRGGYTIQNMEEVLSSGLVEGARITPGQTPPTGSVELTLSNGGQMIVQVTDVAKAEEMLKEYKIYPVINKAEGEGILTTVILPLGVSMLVVMVVISIMNRGGGAGKMANFGKSRARLSLGDDSVTFDGVAGLKEEKEDLQEIVQFLKNPGKFIEVGARIPKGVLLEGPPGTGKTLLAKAIAGEAGVPFFSISGSDFVEMYVGVGASRVRDLFSEAKKHEPCIVFIDEIDAVARQRGTGMGGGHDEREQTLNQLLVEMDGFGVNEGVIVIAATNRVDILDPAIMRPGRFDRKIVVGRPDVGGRKFCGPTRKTSPSGMT